MKKDTHELSTAAVLLSQLDDDPTQIVPVLEIIASLIRTLALEEDAAGGRQAAIALELASRHCSDAAIQVRSAALQSRKHRKSPVV